MPSKSRLLSSTVNKPSSLIGASLSQPNEVNLQALETAATQYTDVTTLPASGYVGEQAFVASTNRLYIWTGTGWFNIALVNTDPTISSAGAANYTMSYGTPITVNVDASDPEGLGLSYSYYTSDSIGSVATISQDSSQFTITPSSDYSVEGSFGLVFRASDGPNIASSSSSTFTLTNQSPSLSGNSGSYVLATDGSTPTVITLTSVDPEGQPITYTATGDSGFNAIATVSNDSSVFTITPKSEDSAVSGTGSLTFTASDGVKSTNAASSFTLNFITTIANTNHTTLLATATDTSDNNNITDASSNSHTITVTGDAYAGTFSPYRSGGYSTLFGSNTNYGRYELTNNISLTGDFTIEFWFSGTEYTGRNQILGSGFNFRKDGSGWYTSISWPQGSYSIPNNEVPGSEWHWVQLIRSSGSAQLYIDGNTVGAAVANTTTYNLNSGYASKLIIGYEATSERLDGYLRDLRISNVARTAAIPTAPLELDSNTHVLLFNKSAQIAETGLSNTLTLTALGDPESHAIGPYDYEEYSAADHGGSVYFVGGADYSSQYLSLSGPTMPSGDFTLSTWAYLTHTVADSKTLIDFNGNSGGFRINYMSNTNGGYHFRFYTAGGTVYLYDQNIDHHLNQWNYIVVVRDSGTFKLYVNSKLINTSAVTPTFSSSTNVRIGQQLGGSGTLEGYLSDIRYNPTTAITDFTPPTAPLSSSGASLHLKGTDASIIDKSQGANLKLEGNTTGSTTQVKFSNTKSMYFDGTGDYIPVITDFFYEKNTSNASTTKFTIETWVYHTARLTYSGYNHIFQTIVGLGNVGLSFGIGPSGNLKFYHQSASTNVVSSTSTISLNTWTHIAVIVDGSQGSSGVTLKINGTTDGTGTWNGISTSQSDHSTPFSSPHFTIGRYPDTFASHQQFAGYLQDLRISNTARTITSAPSAPLEG